MTTTAKALPPKLGPKLRFLAKAAGAITIAFVAFSVLVHIPAGRKLLAPLFGESCPFPAGQVSASDVEAARVSAVRATSGTMPAPSRWALGFELNRSRPADIQAWAARVGATCKDSREGALIKCLDVPSTAVPPGLPGPVVNEVVFAFEPKGMTLVNLTTYVHNAPEAVAALRMKGLRDHLRKVLGPGEERGEFDEGYLSRGDMQTLVVTYRFADYQADLTASRMRPGQVIVREHYVAGAE